MKNLFKASISLLIATTLAKLVGFIREAILVSTYGAGIISDVYITAMNIPLTLFEVIAAALSTTLIPYYFKISNEDNEESSLLFINNIFNCVIFISVILSITGYIFSETLVKLFALNFTGEKLELAVVFTKYFVFSMIFIGLSKILSAWLQIKNNFFIPGSVSIPSNIIIILSIIMSSRYNINILIIGSFVGIMSQFIVQIPFAYRKGFKYRPYINLKDNYIKEMMYLVMPVFIGVGLSQLNSIIDRSLASTLGDGVITILNSASKLEGVISSLFISTIVSVMYPTISKLFNNGKRDEYYSAITKSINIIFAIIIPISIGCIVLSSPIVSVVFERGKFDANDVNMTANALSYYSIGITAVGVSSILNRALYSVGDTKTPMINSAISIVINIILNLLFIKPLGYVGLALATSISSIVCSILMIKSLKKKEAGIDFTKSIIIAIKCLISSGVMGCVVNFAYKFLDLGILGLISSIIIGIVVYFVMLLFFKMDELDEILGYIRYNKAP